MTNYQGEAHGKLILSGEYAVLFGYAGIAIPSKETATATFTPDSTKNDIESSIINYQLSIPWQDYIHDIINHCIALGSIPAGTLTIECDIPLGKGMGSSTALVVAIAKCLLGEDCKEEAQAIEQVLNPNGSGIDFAVIWNEKPIKFTKGQEPKVIDVPFDLDSFDIQLIDTGMPDQQTTEMVEWVTERKEELEGALATIGSCTDRLLAGEDPLTVIRAHHAAQVTLGVVTEEAQQLIKNIEATGGAAKVLGAGSRTGGCGMVLTLNT